MKLHRIALILLGLACLLVTNIAFASTVFDQTPPDEDHFGFVLNNKNYTSFSCALGLNCNVEGQKIYNVGIWMKKVGSPTAIFLHVVSDFNSTSTISTSGISNSISPDSVSDGEFKLIWFFFPEGVVMSGWRDNDQFFQFQSASSTKPSDSNNYYLTLQHPTNDFTGQQQWCQVNRGCNSSPFYFRLDDSQNDLSKQIDPVIIVPGILGSALKDGEWVLDPILHTYDNLAATLRANGYEDHKTLFSFPYDWRQSNVITAQLLDQTINDIKTICQCSKVDIVAHSMGGLVTRQYVQSGDYDGDVDQIVFLGTPHRGAPEAYFAWENAEFPPDYFNFIFKGFLYYLAHKDGYPDSAEYIQEKVRSVQQLLPVYSYLVEEETNLLREYPNNYPTNSFLESLNNSVSSLAPFNILNVYSDKTDSTLRYIEVDEPTSEWEYGVPTNDGNIFTNGDGTVPAVSSNLDFGITTTSLAEHRALPSEESAKVFKFLTGKDPKTVINVGTPQRMLLSFVFSPVDVLIVAPDGKKIGNDPDTDEIINEIPGAFYSGSATDIEYFTIPEPDDGEYKIISKATGEGGNYKISTTYLDGLKESTVDITGIAIPEIIENHELTLVASSSNSVVIPVVPDITAPSVSILSPESKDYTRLDTILISATSTDLESGIDFMKTYFNGEEVINSTTTNFLFLNLGTSTIYAITGDIAGNVASTTLNIRITTTPDSVIATIQKLGDLGLIYKKQIANELISKVQKIIRIEKKIEVIEDKVGSKKVKKQIERLEKRIDKVLARTLIKDFNGYKNGKMEQRAYNVINQDLEWLINNY